MHHENTRYSLLLVTILVVTGCLSQPVLAETGEKTSKANTRTLLTVPYQDREHLLHVMRNNLAKMG